MSVICEIKEHNLLQKKQDSMKKATEKVIKRSISLKPQRRYVI